MAKIRLSTADVRKNGCCTHNVVDKKSADIDLKIM